MICRCCPNPSYIYNIEIEIFYYMFLFLGIIFLIYKVSSSFGTNHEKTKEEESEVPFYNTPDVLMQKSEKSIPQFNEKVVNKGIAYVLLFIMIISAIFSTIQL